MNTENRWLVNLARNHKLLQNSGTHLPQLMNTSGFHQNVGEGKKSLNAMSPDPLLSEAVPPTLARCFQYFFAIFQYFYGHFSIFDIFDRCDIQQ